MWLVLIQQPRPVTVSTHIITIIIREMDKLNTQSPIYYIKVIERTDLNKTQTRQNVPDK